MAVLPLKIASLIFMLLLTEPATQTGLQKITLNSLLGFVNIYDCKPIPNSHDYMIGGYTNTKNFAMITLDSSSSLDKNFLIPSFTNKISRMIAIQPGILFLVGNYGARKVDSANGNLLGSISALHNVKSNALALLQNTDFLISAGYDDQLYRQYKASDLTKIGGDTNLGVFKCRILYQRGLSPIILYSSSPGSSVRSIDYTNRNINSNVITETSTDSITKIMQGRKKNEIIFSGTEAQVIEGNDVNGQSIYVHKLSSTSSSIYEFYLVSGGDVLAAAISSAKKINFYDLGLKTKFTYQISSSGMIISFCYDDSKTLFSVYNNDMMDVFQYVQDVVCSDSNCVRCGFKDNYCLECGPGWIRESGICVQNCPQNKYHNIFSGICEHNPCATDNIFFDGNCYLCASPSIFDERDATCYSTCQDRDPKCWNCKAGTVECNNCVDGYEFDASGICKEKIIPQNSPEDSNEKSKEEKNDNKESYRNLFRVIANSILFSTIINSFFYPNSRSSSLKLIQLFQYYTILEREYNTLTLWTLEVFEGNLFDHLFSFLEDKERYKDKRRDKVAAKLPLSYIKASESQLVYFGILFSLGIFFLCVRLKFFSKEKEKKTEVDKNVDQENKGSDSFNFLEKFDSGWFFILFYDFMIESVIAATQNLFFGYENTLGMVFGFLALLVYFLGICRTILDLHKGKECLYINKELHKDFQKNSKLKYLKVAFLSSDFVKSMGVILLRGRLKLQLMVLIISQFAPVILWISSWKLFILENKVESLFLFSREYLNLMTFIQAIESDDLFLTLLYLQILLSIIETLYGLINICDSCFKEKEPKKNDKSSSNKQKELVDQNEIISSKRNILKKKDAVNELVPSKNNLPNEQELQIGLVLNQDNIQKEEKLKNELLLNQKIQIDEKGLQNELDLSKSEEKTPMTINKSKIKVVFNKKYLNSSQNQANDSNSQKKKIYQTKKNSPRKKNSPKKNQVMNNDIRNNLRRNDNSKKVSLNLK